MKIRSILCCRTAGWTLAAGLVLGLIGFLIAAVCNNDGVCSYEKWSGETGKKGMPAGQNCPDCLPKTYPPLVVAPPEARIVSQGNDTTWSKFKIFQFRAVGTSTVDGEPPANVHVRLWQPFRGPDAAMIGLRKFDVARGTEREG